MSNNERREFDRGVGPVDEQGRPLIPGWGQHLEGFSSEASSGHDPAIMDFGAMCAVSFRAALEDADFVLSDAEACKRRQAFLLELQQVSFAPEIEAVAELGVVAAGTSGRISRQRLIELLHSVGAIQAAHAVITGAEDSLLPAGFGPSETTAPASNAQLDSSEPVAATNLAVKVNRESGQGSHVSPQQVEPVEPAVGRDLASNWFKRAMTVANLAIAATLLLVAGLAYQQSNSANRQLVDQVAAMRAEIAEFREAREERVLDTPGPRPPATMLTKIPRENLLRMRALDDRKNFKVRPVSYRVESSTVTGDADNRVLANVVEYRTEKEIQVELASGLDLPSVFNKIEVCWDWAADKQVVWHEVYSNRASSGFNGLIRHRYEHDADKAPKDREVRIRYHVTNDAEIRAGLGLDKDTHAFDESFRVRTFYDGLALLSEPQAAEVKIVKEHADADGLLYVTVSAAKSNPNESGAKKLQMLVREVSANGSQFFVAASRVPLERLGKQPEEISFGIDLERIITETMQVSAAGVGQPRVFEILVVALPDIGTDTIPVSGFEGSLASKTVSYTSHIH